MRARTVVIFVLASGLLAGCASKEFNEPGRLPSADRSTRKTYSGSFADVWRASLGALAAKRYAVASSQRESGLVLTDWVLGKSDRLYSGYGETRIPYNIRFKMTLKLQPTKSGVHVRVGSEEQYLSDAVTAGADFSGSLYQWITTESSTSKEAALLDEIEAQLVAIRSGAGK
ncbi:MAG: hypothetical protein V1798_07855 [Pseudomonadota bacterium]